MVFGSKRNLEPVIVSGEPVKVSAPKAEEKEDKEEKE